MRNEDNHGQRAHAPGADCSSEPVADALLAARDALDRGPALVDRSNRVILDVTGADRASWLHNLTTNQVKPLLAGDGNYAFSLNIQGRILFDLVVVVRQDSIRLDIDRCFVERAKAHFEKYLIVEDVTVTDRSDDLARFALVGEQASAWLSRYGLSQAATMAEFGSATGVIEDVECFIFRTDFCGPKAFEIAMPREAMAAWRERMLRLSDPARVIAVGDDAVQLRRIEAGIPWPGREITDEHLPAETSQFGRAVNTNKGCYLGQEIVERMRTRDVVARRLVGLRFEESASPAAGAQLEDKQGAAIGMVTSICHSPRERRAIGLGYIKTMAAETGTCVCARWNQSAADAVVASLPFDAPC